MNFIEQEVRRALARQAAWEGFDIRDDRLTRLAENVVSALGLTEFGCGGDRWWSTKFYPVQELPA